MDNTNPTLGLSIYLPSPEVVEEVHVSTSNYSAEFGRVGGAVVNATTKSGTNATSWLAVGIQSGRRPARA